MVFDTIVALLETEATFLLSMVFRQKQIFRCSLRLSSLPCLLCTAATAEEEESALSGEFVPHHSQLRHPMTVTTPRARPFLAGMKKTSPYEDGSSCSCSIPGVSGRRLHRDIPARIRVGSRWQGHTGNPGRLPRSGQSLLPQLRAQNISGFCGVSGRFSHYLLLRALAGFSGTIPGSPMGTASLSSSSSFCFISASFSGWLAARSCFSPRSCVRWNNW